MAIEICGEDGLYLPTEGCECPDGGGASIEKVLYADLKAMRDAGELTPGQTYRIIDYEATTTQPYTSVVPHSFDILVTADSETTLNENARAMLRRNDSYYTASDSGADLSAWRLKYTVDNDQTRFAWADPANGKGVVFYLEDENHNVAPYDFKQIVFRIDQISVFSDVPDFVGSYGSVVTSPADTTLQYGSNKMAYTFSVIDDQTGTVYDLSVKDRKYMNDQSLLHTHCCNNVIEPANYKGSEASVFAPNEPYMLNHNVMVQKSSSVKSVIGNTFGVNSKYNILNDQCDNNTFGKAFVKNIASNITDNTFAPSASGNFLFYFIGNQVGSGFEANLIGTAHLNTFGNEVTICRLYGFNYNQMGNSCEGVVMQNKNQYAEGNTFGNYISSVSFRCNFLYNTFENNIHNSEFVSVDEIHMTPMQYYKVLEGTTSNNTSISIVPLRTYTTFIGLDSNDTLQQWVPADAVT